jgi:hypothetical protein
MVTKRPVGKRILATACGQIGTPKELRDAELILER